MEFWGVEVEPGKLLLVTPEEDTFIHTSQASLGDCKNKKGESVSLYVKVGDQKLVLGTLFSQSIPQISGIDLIFDKEFELSHKWGKGSVYFVGYKSPYIEDQEGEDYFSDSKDEEVPVPITANGNAAKAIAKPAEEEESDSEDGMDDEDDSEEEEEKTPKKHEASKKRANEAAPKTPVSAKKAKAAVTPQKIDFFGSKEKKKGGHTATPHPAKKGGKTSMTASKSSKSAGQQVSCGSCKKTFNSGNALESHNKAKHEASK